MKVGFYFSLLLIIFTAFLSPLHANAQNKDAVPDQSRGKVPGQYIVVFKNTVDSDQTTSDLEKKHKIAADFRYTKALNGFAAKLSADQLEKIKQDSRVQFVTQDREVEIARVGSPKKPSSPPPPQTPSTGFSRIGASTSASNSAATIGVAVIDTGIQLNHPDLAANIAGGYNCLNPRKSANDDNGHGTHVAGIIAAKNNTIGVVGVAPDAKLFAVKVLNMNGSGTWSSVICGIDWVTKNASTSGIKVANMSLGGGGSSDNNCGNTNNDALHKALCASTDAGITYAVAAGNDGQNAASFVPAAYADTLISVSALADSDGVSGGVGSSTGYGVDDTFATFSNYGSMVGIGAPGVYIYSTYTGSSYATLSGTSMATPFVSGAAALYIKTHAGASWTDVKNALQNIGETVGNGHTDPSGNHNENVLKVNSLN